MIQKNGNGNGKKSNTRKAFGGSVELISANNLAKEIGVHIESIRRYIRKGSLAGTKIGREYFVSKDNFVKFLDGKKATKK